MYCSIHTSWGILVLPKESLLSIRSNLSRPQCNMLQKKKHSFDKTTLNSDRATKDTKQNGDYVTVTAAVNMTSTQEDKRNQRIAFIMFTELALRAMHHRRSNAEYL